MKKIVVHIGYPKAASTSLQNSLFLELHNLGLIHFLGRAFQSGYFGEAKNKEEFKGWLKIIYSGDNSVFPSDNENRPVPFSMLSPERINVFSEGAFILNDRLEKQFVMPERIHSYFTERADQVEILIILRSQTTLIMSNYVQRFRKIKKKFADYLDEHMRGPKKETGDFKIYNFLNLVRAYAEVFGKENIHILFFEDYVKDRSKFVEDLREIFNVDPVTLHDSLGSTHLNKTKIGGGFYYPKKLAKIKTLRLQLGRAFKKMGIHWGFLMQYKIPEISASEKKLIFEAFKQSNLRLAQEFSLDENRMKQYGYF